MPKAEFRRTDVLCIYGERDRPGRTSRRLADWNGRFANHWMVILSTVATCPAGRRTQPTETVALSIFIECWLEEQSAG